MFVYTVNNTNPMLAAKQAIQELFSAGMIPTTLYRHEIYGEVESKKVRVAQYHEPFATTRTVMFCSRVPEDWYEGPEVFVFLRARGSAERATEWEAYQVWVSESTTGDPFYLQYHKMKVFQSFLGHYCWNLQEDRRRKTDLVVPPPYHDWKQYFS